MWHAAEWLKKAASQRGHANENDNDPCLLCLVLFDLLDLQIELQPPYLTCVPSAEGRNQLAEAATVTILSSGPDHHPPRPFWQLPSPQLPSPSASSRWGVASQPASCQIPRRCCQELVIMRIKPAGVYSAIVSGGNLLWEYYCQSFRSLQ